MCNVHNHIVEVKIMAKVKFSTNVKWSGNKVLSVADINGKEVTIDEPPSLGGTDQGPNPVEYLLAALGGCINVVIVTFARKFKVVVEDVQTYVEGDLDTDGFLGKNPDVRPGYQEIRYHIQITSSSPEENIQALIAHAEKVCPVKDSLKAVPIVSIKKPV